jgi:hypothetical protein
MNQQLARRLRELERKCAEKLNSRRSIRIVWAPARRVGGPAPINDVQVVLDSSEGCETNILDDDALKGP